MIEEGSIEENEAVNYYYNQLEEPEKDYVCNYFGK